MDKLTAAVIVVGILTLAIVAFFSVFRSRGKAKIIAPFGTKVELEGENTAPAPPPAPGARIEGAKSRSGSIVAEDRSGRGVEVRNVEAEKDIQAINAPRSGTDDPK